MRKIKKHKINTVMIKKEIVCVKKTEVRKIEIKTKRKT